LTELFCFKQKNLSKSLIRKLWPCAKKMFVSVAYQDNSKIQIYMQNNPLNTSGLYKAGNRTEQLIVTKSVVPNIHKRSRNNIF